MAELKKMVNQYTYWYNNERISLNNTGLTPTELKKEVGSVDFYKRQQPN
ncbi:IS3 family transposase [Xylocopilactobacillus apis]|nr:IS3 family transposase [Xylocopilactobacillus apis]